MINIEDKDYGNCVYGVRYLPGAEFQNDYIGQGGTFFGKMLNFYSAGKCAFQNEITGEILIMPYASIECIYPLKNYPQKYLDMKKVKGE